MSRGEYLVASTVLRAFGAVFSLLPVQRDRVVLASARSRALQGNLAYIHRELRTRYPAVKCVLLLEPYSYSLAGKLAYFARLIRGMYHLRTAGVFVVDNAYLPIHVAPHRPSTLVVQVWHATGALKRFGLDTSRPLGALERSFLHRYYDCVVVAAEESRAPHAAALRTPIERVLALGSPHTDFFFDPAAMARARARVLAAYPALAGRRVVLYAPTFRGRGRRKRPAEGLDAVRLRAALPSDHVLVLKTHPNLDPALTPTAGYDVVLDPAVEIDHVFTVTDVLVTDYSSSIFEYSLLGRPLVLLVGDLAEYEADPGLYLNYRTEMIGTQVTDTDGAAEAILGDRFDLSGYQAFTERHLGASMGGSSSRVVRYFLEHRA